MKSLRGLAIALLFILVACQSPPPATIAILDGRQTIIVDSGSRIPADLFVRAGLIVGPNDRPLFNGIPVPLDRPLPQAAAALLQLQRSVAITIVNAGAPQTLQTNARTVGQALREAGITLYAIDQIDPPVETPISSSLTINFTPSREVTISVQGGAIRARSAAKQVGDALAEAGLPLMGLNYSLPTEESAFVGDGNIRFVHVSESLVLAQKPIPFENEFLASAEVPLDQQQVLNPGQPGLTVSRVRIRYEDGQEVSRQTESETTVRTPANRIVGYGTKVEVKTASVGGEEISYWRAVQMFATAYSPCRSGPGQCYPNTASGKPVKKGVVALRTDLYVSMRGQALFIPGYGYASVEDACGGCVGKPWIDLGYSDNDYESWGSWVTVYFLAPIPSNIIYVLD
jgi:uncharacterized protein YabE (DUF348 family)